MLKPLLKFLAKILYPHLKELTSITTNNVRTAQSLCAVASRQIERAEQIASDTQIALANLQENVYLLQDHLHAFGDYFGVDFAVTDGQVACTPKNEEVKKAVTAASLKKLDAAEQATLATLFNIYRRIDLERRRAGGQS